MQTKFSDRVYPDDHLTVEPSGSCPGAVNFILTTIHPDRQDQSIILLSPEDTAALAQTLAQVIASHTGPEPQPEPQAKSQADRIYAIAEDLVTTIIWDHTPQGGPYWSGVFHNLRALALRAEASPPAAWEVELPQGG